MHDGQPPVDVEEEEAVEEPKRKKSKGDRISELTVVAKRIIQSAVEVSSTRTLAFLESEFAFQLLDFTVEMSDQQFLETISSNMKFAEERKSVSVISAFNVGGLLNKYAIEHESLTRSEVGKVFKISSPTTSFFINFYLIVCELHVEKFVFSCQATWKELRSTLAHSVLKKCLEEVKNKFIE